MIVSNGRAALVSSLQRPPAGPHLPGLGPAPGGAAPVPLPTFSRGGAVLILSGVGNYAGVGVTVEPSGGSQQPSSAPFVVASL